MVRFKSGFICPDGAYLGPDTADVIWKQLVQTYLFFLSGTFLLASACIRAWCSRRLCK